jgi:hypothetical protein
MADDEGHIIANWPTTQVSPIAGVDEHHLRPLVCITHILFFCLTHNYIRNCKSSQNLKKLWITQVCSLHQSCERTYTTVKIVSQLEKLRISASTTLDAKYS